MLLSSVLAGIGSWRLEQVCMAAEMIAHGIVRGAIKSAILIALASLIAFTFRRSVPMVNRYIWQMTTFFVLLLFTDSLMTYGVLAPPSFWPGSPGIRSGATAAQTIANAPLHALDAVPASLFRRIVSDPTKLPLPTRQPAYSLIGQDTAALRDYTIGLASLGFVLVWALGCIACLLRLGVGLLHLRGLRRNIRVVDAQSAVGQAADAVGLLAASDWLTVATLPQAGSGRDGAVPMTWGHKPIIVLPEEAQQWPDERLRCALLHEWSHVAGGDWDMQLWASLGCALQWFNPLVWLSARALRADGERVADRHVVARGIAPADYSAHLLEIARSLSAKSNSRRWWAKPPAQAMPMARAQKLESRLRAILALNPEQRLFTPELQRLLRIALIPLFCAFYISMFTNFAGATNAVVNPWIKPYPLAPSGRGAQPSPTQTIVAAPGASSVTLPNGATVTLLGIRDTQSKRWLSWLPNGSPILHETHPMTEAGNIPFNHMPPGAVGRAFVVMMRCPEADQPTLPWDSPAQLWYSLDGDAPRGTHRMRTQWSWWIEPRPFAAKLVQFAADPETAGDGTLTTMIVPPQLFRPTDRACTLRYAVAAGPWTQTVSCAKRVGTTTVQTPSGGVSFQLIPNAHSIYKTWPSDYAQVIVSDHFSSGLPKTPSIFGGDGDYDRDLVALNSQGRALYDFPAENALIKDSLLARVASFRLSARPYYWAEFRNVPLQPR